MNIKKIEAVYDGKNKKELTFLRAYVTMSDGTTRLVKDNLEIHKYLRKLEAQEGEKVNGISKRKLEIIKSTNRDLNGWESRVIQKMQKNNDKAERRANDARFRGGILNKKSPYNGKKTRGLKKALRSFAFTLVTGVSALVTGCSANKAVNAYEASQVEAPVVVDISEDLDLELQLTDKEALNATIDEYLDKQDYGIQYEFVSASKNLIDEVNTKFKAIALKDKDGNTFNGLLTIEEAFAYVITMNNLSGDQVKEIYQDSGFDYATFEDDKQQVIKKLIQYEQLVALGVAEQFDPSVALINNANEVNEFSTDVSEILLSSVTKIGSAVKASDNKTVKEAIDEYLSNVKKYMTLGNLTQGEQDIVAMMVSPTFYSVQIIDRMIGYDHVSTKLQDELITAGLCVNNNEEEKKEEEKVDVQSQHDQAWADAATTLRDVEKELKESIDSDSKDEYRYSYYVKKALQELANEADREEKSEFLKLTVENSKKVHEKAESLVKEYVKSLGIVEDSKQYNEKVNAIITDESDKVLYVETLTFLLKEDGIANGLYLDDSISGINFALSEAIGEKVAEQYLKYGDTLGNKSSTALPSNKKEQKTTTNRSEVVEIFGESEVKNAENKAHNNTKAKEEAQKKAEQIQQTGQNALKNDDKDTFVDNAANPEEAGKWYDNQQEEEKKVEESGKVTMDQDVLDKVEKDDGFIEVEQGKTPDVEEEIYTGDISDIEWSDGETLGGNADKPVEEVITDPSTSIQNDAPVVDSNPEPISPPVVEKVPSVDTTPSKPSQDQISIPEEGEYEEPIITGGDITSSIPSDLIESIVEVPSVVEEVAPVVEAVAPIIEEIPVVNEEVSNFSVDVSSLYEAATPEEVAASIVEAMASNPTSEENYDMQYTK